MKVGQTADQAWLGLLKNILDNGSLTRPRGLLCREILANTTCVDMNFPVTTCRPKLGYKFMVAEAWWILSGKNDVQSIRPYSSHIASFSNDGIRFDGAYGPRIVDQLRFVIDTLSTDPDSRQAVIEIWRPNPRPSRDIPCTLTVQFMVRDGKLCCFDTMRSSDAWLGWCYDVYNFACLSTYVVLCLRQCCPFSFKNLQLGNLYLTAGSQHLYVNPVIDGATNIPYLYDDVLEVMGDCDFGTGNPSHPLSRMYRTIDLAEFSQPDRFIFHLECLKDRAFSTQSDWLHDLMEVGK